MEGILSHPKEPKEGDGMTWSQWAAEKAIAAEHVAAEGAIMVKDSTVSTVKYVKDAAASTLHSIAEPATNTNAKNDDVASKDKTNSVQDRADRYTTTGRISEPTEGDSTTWSQWAAEKAIAAEHVAAEGAIMVKDSTVSTVKYVTDAAACTLDAAASTLHRIAEPTTTNNAKNDNVASKDKTNSVQDRADRYSTTRRISEYGQKSVTRAPTIKERALNTAQSWKLSAASALTPGEGDKELAKTITAHLSSLPTRMKEKMLISSKGEGSTRTFSLVDGVARSSSSATVEKFLQHMKHENVEPKSEATSSTKVTDEEKLDAIAPEKLMELWTIGSGNLDVTNGNVDSESLLSPQSVKAPTAASSAAPRTPKTPTSTSPAREAKHTNAKAEAIAEAHRSRVITEGAAYVEAEMSKAEAYAQKMHVKTETERLHAETRAIETLKKEERRADLLVNNAETKARQILTEAKSTAGSIQATAEEEYAKSMADAKTKAERWLAEIEETRQTTIAELHDRVERMILMREFPLPAPERKKESVVKKVKEKVKSRIRGY